VSLTSLADAIKKELSTLGMPSVLEMALVSTKGIVLYSDLSKVVMSRISPFYESMTQMTIGDNLSLALDSTKTIVASRISNGAVLITVTDKKVGIVLTKMGGVADKFGRLLDELIKTEESKTRALSTFKEAAVRTTPSPPPPEPIIEEAPPPEPIIEEAPPPEPIIEEAQPSAPVIEEAQAPAVPSREPRAAPRRTVEKPVAVAKEVKEAEEEPEAVKVEVAGMYVSLSSSTILEAVPKPKVEGMTLDGEMIKLLRSVDGFKSVDAVAKQANVKLERALKKLGLLTQGGILKLKYDDPVYNSIPKVAAKLDSELQSMAFSKADLPNLTPDVLKQIDGKKNVLTLASELDIDPEKLRDILKILEKRKMIKL
jgi:hypothetical protein